MSDSKTEALSGALQTIKTHAATQPPSLSLRETDSLAAIFGLTRRDVEIAALEHEVLPERYRRNHGTVGWQGQIRLLKSTVGIVGAGGLGGWIIEGLARMGVGHLIVIDGDVFEENNLNRQAGCTEEAVGRPKAQVMAERIREVNRSTVITAHTDWLTSDNGVALLGGSQIIVDALDSLPMRFTLQAIAREMGVPMVHGAIAGYTGQVTTIYPEDAGLASIYGPGPYPVHGIETELGNPTATPMMAASWELQQVVKYVIGSERGLLRSRLLLMDAQAGETLTLDLVS
ncbi:MAG: ThiF family adenylyltransferase [Anaerolineae bacterium]